MRRVRAYIRKIISAGQLERKKKLLIDKITYREK